MEISVTFNIEVNSDITLWKNLSDTFERLGINNCTAFIQEVSFIKQVPNLNVEFGWYPKLTNIKELYDLRYCQEIYQMRCCRMQQMTNQIMHALNNMGFQIDSSALPRKKGWEHTGYSPYHPFVNDYSCTGNPSLGILEVPISFELKNKDFKDCFAEYAPFITKPVVSFCLNDFEEIIENLEFINTYKPNYLSL